MNIPFTTSEKYFDNEHEVINWIIDNQLSRRNITDDQRAYLLGKRYKEEKKVVGENQFNNIKADLKKLSTTKPMNNPVNDIDRDRSSHSDHITLQSVPARTIEKIAEQIKVSPETVQRAEKFTEAVDKVAENIGINPQHILFITFI